MFGLSAEKLDLYLWFYPAAVLFFALALAATLGWRVSNRTGLILGTLGVVFSLFNGARRFWINPEAVDFERNWNAGRAWRDGVDPYPLSEMINYPPYALPFFGLSALGPFESMRVVMLVINLLGAALLVPLAALALRAQRRLDPAALSHEAELPVGTLALFTAAVALSLPVYFSVTLGQPTIYIALAAAGALIAQGHGRPILAGLLLAVAAVKPQTALPLLALFFCRRKDATTWLTFIATVGICWLFSSPLDQLGPRLSEMLANAKTLTAPGQVNDFSDAGTQSHSLLGFDRLLFCLGLHDRTLVRVAQALLMLLGGGWLMWQVLRRGWITRPAAAALVCVAAFFFLYHRTYDLTLLALPLVYLAGRARGVEASLPGPGRRWAAIGAVAILLLLIVHPRLPHAAGLKLDRFPLVGMLAHALLMPMFIWLLLLVVGCVAILGKPGRAHVDAVPQ